MSPVDRGVHRHRPVQSAVGISGRQQRHQHPVPGPVTGVATMTFPHRLPRPELRSRQVTPRDAGAIPVDDAFHHTPIITERMTTTPLVGGQQTRNPLPLSITEVPIPRSRRHFDSIPSKTSPIWETRPNRPVGIRMRDSRPGAHTGPFRPSVSRFDRFPDDRPGQLWHPTHGSGHHHSQRARSRDNTRIDTSESVSTVRPRGYAPFGHQCPTLAVGCSRACASTHCCARTPAPGG